MSAFSYYGRGATGPTGPTGPQGAAGAAGAAGATGATGAAAPVFASFVQYGMQTATLTSGSGSTTTGYGFTVLTGGGTYRGVELRWKWTTGTESVKVSVWDSGGTLVAASVVTFSIAADGYYYVAFASTLTLAAGTYTIGVFASNSRYTWTSTTPTFALNFGGNYTLTSAGNLYSAGDARPTTTAASERYTNVALVPT